MADLLKTLYQIVLAGIVGGIFAYAWQKRGWIFQQNLKIAVDKHESQIQLIKDFFGLVDKRIYASRLYLDELTSGDPERIKAQKEIYGVTVAEWNERNQGMVVMLRSRFDHQTANAIETYFPPEFAQIDAMLRRKRLLGGSDPIKQRQLTEDVRKGLSRINREARSVMHDLFEKTSDTLIILEEKPPIKLSNAERLSALYLFKSLFKARV